jgi:hypothetical protein
MPPRKDARAVWIDGQWDWDRGRFRWIEGHWEVPPPDAYFTPWSTRRLTDGTLVFQSAAWRAPNGRRLQVSPAALVCPPNASARRTP